MRSRNGLRSDVLQKIALVSENISNNPNDITEFQKFTTGPKRCRSCLNNAKGNAQKEEKDKLKKIKTCCQKCGDAQCSNHFVQICLGCLDKIKRR